MRVLIVPHFLIYLFIIQYSGKSLFVKIKLCELCKRWIRNVLVTTLCNVYVHGSSKNRWNAFEKIAVLSRDKTQPDNTVVGNRCSYRMPWHLALYANRNYQKACRPNLPKFSYDHALRLVLLGVESRRSCHLVAADYNNDCWEEYRYFRWVIVLDTQTFCTSSCFTRLTLWSEQKLMFTHIHKFSMRKELASNARSFFSHQRVVGSVGHHNDSFVKCGCFSSTSVFAETTGNPRITSWWKALQPDDVSIIGLSAKFEQSTLNFLEFVWV